MSDEDPNSECGRDDVVDLDRREVLASLAKYSATVAGASTLVLTASASVSRASFSGGGGNHGGGGQNPGNSKPVGNSPFNGTRGQVPSGRIK